MRSRLIRWRCSLLALPSALRFSLLLLFLCGSIAVAWWPAASAPYQYDDYVTPVKDPASQSLSSWVRALPRTLRPLTKLSYALESSVGADSAPARRVFQAGAFALAAVLLALLARELGLGWFGAAALSTLWACHPVHAETVVALAGRSVLLALLLTLASAWFWLRGRTRSALACALLAVLARETALVWLVVCAGLAVRAQGRFDRKRLAALATAALLGSVWLLCSSRLRELLAFSFSQPDAFNRLGLQWAALSREIWLLFAAPAEFNVDMDFAPTGGRRLGYVLATMGLYGLALGAAWSKRAPLGVRLGALFWLAWVLPLHSVVPKLDALTARSASASSAAWVLLFAAAASRVRLTHGRAIAACAAALVALLFLVELTRERARLYRDPVALWRDAADKSEVSLRPLINLGTLLAQRDRLAEAEVVLERATGRNPSNAEARERLEAVRLLLGAKNLMTAPPAHEIVIDHETIPH